MEFEYAQQLQFTAQLDVDDIGNCAIHAIDTMLLQDYYLVIKTDEGITSIMQAGPFTIDQDMLGKKCSITFDKMDYNEHKINGIISKFLNNPKVDIQQAELLDELDALNACINIPDYMKRAWR